MFANARMRALSTRLAPGGSTERATWFSSEMSTAAHSLAVCAWSGVRFVLVAPPMALISFTSSAYFLLVRSGGGAGRNCDGLAIANGASIAICGKAAGNVPSGFVGVGTERQTPGPVPPKYGGSTAVIPSVLRQARIRLATCAPQATPRAIEGLLPWLPGIAASED